MRRAVDPAAAQWPHAAAPPVQPPHAIQQSPHPSVRRVLMTADAVGGVWPYALDLADALQRRGVSATIAVMGPAPRGGQLAEAEGRGIEIVSRPFRLEWMQDAWGDVAAAGEWLLDFERVRRPDIVHLNGYCHAALPWRAPVVVVAHSCVRSWWRAVHGCDAPSEWDCYGEAVARGLDAASLVVAPTGAMAAALREEYGFTHRVSVIANARAGLDGVHADRAEKAPIVLAAGRLWDAAKNIDALCSVAPGLPWPVYVAGDASAPDGTCCDIASVHCLGRLDTAELYRWFARASIYALPARYEPFGLSVLEAAAHGCALVLGDIRSLRENWSDAAVFVPPDNRRALQAALRQLIDDDERRADLAACAAARARAFRMPLVAEAYLAAYSRALAPTMVA